MADYFVHFSVGTLYPLHHLRNETSTFLWCCIRAGIVEEFAFADEEWDCWLASTSAVAVLTEVARIGHRATREVRPTREEQALRERCSSDLAGVEDV